MKALLLPLTAKAKQRCGSKTVFMAEILRTECVACFNGDSAHRVLFPNGHERWIRTFGDVDFRVEEVFA